MILCVENLFHSLRLASKPENRHHHCRRHRCQYGALMEDSVRAFNCDVSKGLARLLSELQLGSGSVSLSWIQNSSSFLARSNEAFAKLVIEIDYPMSKWEVPFIEEYLNYSLRFLDLLNSVKSSLSHASQARLLMTHALSIIESSAPSAIRRLGSVKFMNKDMDLKIEEDVKDRIYSGKESIVHHALTEIKRNSDMVFGIVLSSLSGDVEPYARLASLTMDASNLEGFNEKNAVLRELKEANEAKDCLVGALEIGKISRNDDEDVKKLGMDLEEIEKQLDDIGKNVDDLFSEMLAGRNELLDVLRHQKP